jgi:hypothetical protein
MMRCIRVKIGQKRTAAGACAQAAVLASALGMMQLLLLGKQ